MKIFLFIIFGLILRSSPALDIIHEFMHYGWCNIEGIEVLQFNWDSIVYAEDSALVLYGGYYSELVLYAFLVMCFAYYRKYLASFFLGILIVVFFKSFYSLDFNEYALRYYGDPARVTAGLVRWGLLSTAIMACVMGIFVKGQRV